MSHASRQRMREAAQKAGNRRSRKRKIGALLLVLAGVAIFCFPEWGARWRESVSTSKDVPQKVGLFKIPLSFQELCDVGTNDLAKCDIALMNLLCAVGLRGSQGLDVRACMGTLDKMAKAVEYDTTRHLYRFREHPEEFNHSEGYYRMMMMVTVLQQDFGIHYDPKHMNMPGEPSEPDEIFFADSSDVFIHGLLHQGGTGTCSSMPVFYVAVGRRLGYPLKLVRVKGHLLARWEQGSDSFNIEATTLGFVSHPDAYYRSWPFPFTPEEAQRESYLKPLTSLQELATFLTIRGHCCRAAKNWKGALGAYAQAFYKEPQSEGNQRLFAWSEKKAFEAGVLPKRAAIQFAIRSLEIPPGPMQSSLAVEKQLLVQRNNSGEDEQAIERDLEILKAEVRGAELQSHP